MTSRGDVREKVHEYLSFGYLIPDAIGDDPIGFSKNKTKSEDKKVWFDRIEVVLDAVFERILTKLSGNGKCIVPLSGGWDSRVILAECLKRVGKDRVKTVTFGVPGQYDYDVGNFVAEYLKLNHTPLNLDNIPISFEGLVATAKASKWTYMPDAFYNEMARRSVFEAGDIVLVGFMGDPTTGSLLKSNKENDSVLSFMRSQIRGPGIGPDVLDKLEDVKFPRGEDGSSSFFNLNLRQRYCILPIISNASDEFSWSESLPVCQNTGAPIFSPFSSIEWMRLWFDVPDNLLNGQDLYLSYFRQKFPEIFSLPSKYSYGLSDRNHLGKVAVYIYLGLKYFLDKVVGKKRFFYETANYINYDNAFLLRDDYIDVLKRSFEIVSRELDVENEFERKYFQHKNARVSHSEYFLMVIGAAANIKACE